MNPQERENRSSPEGTAARRKIHLGDNDMMDRYFTEDSCAQAPHFLLPLYAARRASLSYPCLLLGDSVKPFR